MIEENKQKNIFMKVFGYNPTFNNKIIEWLNMHNEFKTREKIYYQSEKIKSDLDKFIRCINFPPEWKVTPESFDKFKRNLVDDVLNLSENIRNYMVSAERIQEKTFYEKE